MHRYLFLLCVLITAGCATGGTALAPESITFAPALQVDLAAMERTNTGVLFRDLEEGDGPRVRRGSRVSMHYAGFLPDGTAFEQRAAPSPAVEFTVGDGSVVPGLERGMIGMRAGGQRQLVIPSSQGYGGHSVGRVPAHATLVFIIKVVSVR